MEQAPQGGSRVVDFGSTVPACREGIGGPMCGILGIWSTDGVSGASFRAALDLMAHRGPDDEGYLVAGGGPAERYRGDATTHEIAGLAHIDDAGERPVLLGHRRLSIIDTSCHGHQPFADPTGRYHLIYNGELFNYLELREELRSTGLSFQSGSDTEVVLAALITWGPKAFRRFNGMWALALWDDHERSLLLSRDRFGIKPLYVASTPRRFGFGSTMRAVRSLIDGGGPDTDSIARYLDRSLLNDTTRTFWAAVRELPPGSYATYDGVSYAEHQYWRFEPRPSGLGGREAAERFAELFEDSLKLRMRSDVPVGTLLSGGLDSSTIVCALHSLGLIEPGRFESFSAVFDEEEFSERRYAEAVVQAAELLPHWVYPSVSDIERDLDTLFFHVEQPFRSLAVYSQHLLYRAVGSESDVKVLLNGQGADELFGGYTRHYYVLFGHLFGRGRLLTMVDEMHRFSRERGVPFRRAARTSLGHMRAALGRPDYFNEVTFAEVTGSALREYLAYDDRNSMAASVEARVPFMDYRLVEFAFGLDTAQKIEGFASKRIEREYARRIVPPLVVERADKMGFVSPQEQWQREQLAPAMRSSRSALARWVAGGPLDGRTDLLERMDRYLGSRGAGDWAFAWRVHCLDRWLAYEGVTV